MINYVVGDLIELAKNGEFNVIVQGCNCFCKMNSGVAKAIRENFIEAYIVDQMTVPGDPKKLGTYTCASRPNLTIVNAYTQFDYGYDGKLRFSYEAFYKVMNRIAKDFNGFKIGMPKIGSGLAGGDWKLIEKIIRSTMIDQNVTIVVKES